MGIRSQRSSRQRQAYGSLLLAAVLGASAACSNTGRRDPVERAVELGRTGEPRQAERLLLEAVERNPHRHQAFNQLGLIAFEAKRYDAAIGYFERAVQLHGLSVIYRRNLALAQAHAGRLQDARQTLAAARSMDPDDALLLLDSAKLSYLGGDVDRAIQTLDAVEQMAPSLREVDTLREAWSDKSR